MKTKTIVNRYNKSDHTFVICAYNESDYLEECIKSLLNQSVRSNVAIATSTPNDTIEVLAKKYKLPVYVNKGIGGIAGDWNFAISCAETKLVTIAHQDDIYLQDYTKMLIKAFNRADNPIIFSSNYAELRDGEIKYFSPLIAAKKIMTFPMLLMPSSKKARRFAISYGNGICCPSVTYVTDIIKCHPFKSGMKSNLDWDRWDELSKLDGSFLYCPKVAMLHRIHDDAETSKLVGSNSRINEDIIMFNRFHSPFITKFISKIYVLGERNYKK